MLSWKRVGESPWVQTAIGGVASAYLGLVIKTSRFVIEPADIYDRCRPDLPFIVAMWHGQHFLMPYVKPPEVPVKVLISRHRDGGVNAAAARRFGLGIVRGSGTHGSDVHRKGGSAAFRQMVAALEQGYTMALTADVPKIPRVAGLGIVKLAMVSGRPIYPIAVATSRRFELDNWDRSTINLPFSHGAAVFAGPIHAPTDADDAGLEACRKQVEVGLNAVTARAYELADRRGRDADRG
ncbi:MAG TPA: lysophospholipid acyltransferase family protein [Xanthobacteraceae bacterium]